MMLLETLVLIVPQIFLGCPHRGTALELQATLTKLLYLQDDRWHPNIHTYVEHLAEVIEYTNGEFYDTNMLIRAGVFNIYNQDVSLPSNWGPCDSSMVVVN